MTIDLTTLSLDEKRERVMRYASGRGAAVVPMDEPELSEKLAEYVRWERDEQRTPIPLLKARHHD